MLELLQSAVRNGTGNAARLPIATYGKTGTTQNHRDALFIGFAGDLVVGVWVGNDDNSPMGGSVVGGTVPAKLWRRFMTAALTRDGALAKPVTRRGDAIGELVGAIAGPDAGDAADAVVDVISNAAEGNVDPEAIAAAADRAAAETTLPPPQQ